MQFVGSTMQIASYIVGTIANLMTENMREVRLVCKNIFLNILKVKGTMDFCIIFQLH